MTITTSPASPVDLVRPQRPVFCGTWPRGAFRFCGLPGRGDTEHLIATETSPGSARTLCGLDGEDRYELGLPVIPIVVVGRSTASDPGGRVFLCPACAAIWATQQPSPDIPPAAAPAATTNRG